MNLLIIKKTRALGLPQMIFARLQEHWAYNIVLNYPAFSSSPPNIQTIVLCYVVLCGLCGRLVVVVVSLMHWIWMCVAQRADLSGSLYKYK
jgi:hypothetical protein